jgi:hypothetical protein
MIADTNQLKGNANGLPIGTYSNIIILRSVENNLLLKAKYKNVVYMSKVHILKNNYFLK